MAADREWRSVALASDTSSLSPPRLKHLQPNVTADSSAGAAAAVLTRERSRDPRLMSSVESFAAYIQTHFARASDKWVPPVDPKHVAGVAAVRASESSRSAAAAAAAEDALRRELREWIERWEDEKRLNTALSTRMQEIREVLEKKLVDQQAAHDEQVLQLKREAAVVKAKLAAQALDVRASSAGQPAAGSDAPGSAKPPAEGEGEGGPLAALVEEQERLLEGYQRENERLYAELKKASGERKAVEDGLLRDNHRLASELAMLREQLEAKEAALRARHVANSPRADTVMMHHDNNSGAALGAGRIAELSAELKQAKVLTSKLQADVDRLVRERGDLESRAGQLVAERDRLIDAASGRERSAAAQASLEGEVERLTKKVRWYAENQELLDRDAQRLKEKDSTIESLREQLRHAQSEAGQKQLEAKVKGKERSADAKRIQDLERQVKELEGILRKRNPNSLPALMMAAAAAVGTSPDQKAAGAAQTPALRFLEDRVRRLEHEVDGKDDECKVALRAAEQRLSALREKYEERIQGLEQDLAAAVRSSHQLGAAAGERPYSTASALQRELDAVRESYKKKVADMQHESDSLRAELEATRQKLQSTVKADAAASRQAAAESADKLKEAEAALDKKHVELMQLLDTIERLQLEKRQLVSELALLRPSGAAAAPLPAPPDVKRPAAARRPVASATTRVDRGRRAVPNGARLGAEGAFRPFVAQVPSTDAAVSSRSDYTPQNFTDQHVDDVLEDNERLKAEVERLELQLSQLRVDQQRALAELEAERRREHEQLLDELSALKRAHQTEIEKIVAAHAAFNSSSKVTELSCKVEAQEVIIKHLKEDRDRWRTDADELAASRIRELALRADVQALKVQLDDAKRFHTPEMRHYDALIRKINEVEARNGQRERDMRLLFAQLSGGGARLQDGGSSADATRWQQALQAKQLQVESFRTELDSILNILRDLKRSGVTLPVVS